MVASLPAAIGLAFTMLLAFLRRSATLSSWNERTSCGTTICLSVLLMLVKPPSANRQEISLMQACCGHEIPGVHVVSMQSIPINDLLTSEQQQDTGHFKPSKSWIGLLMQVVGPKVPCQSDRAIKGCGPSKGITCSDKWYVTSGVSHAVPGTSCDCIQMATCNLIHCQGCSISM